MEKSTHHDSVESLNSRTPLRPNEYAHLSLWQSLKKFQRVVFYSLGMTSAILMYGYDYVIVGTVSAMPSFQHEFGVQLGDKWIIPSLWLGLWNFISPGCAMVGAITAGYFQDRYGRRACLAVGSFCSAAAVAICYVSNLPPDIHSRRGVFLAGKGFQGWAIGMVMTTSQTYLSEVLPTNLRGPLLAFFPIFTLLGQLVGAAVIFANLNLPKGYIACFASQWPFSAIPLLMAFIIPESPAYLIRKNQYDKAYKSQKRLDMPGMDTEKTLQILKEDIEHERQFAKATYLDCFRKGNLRRSLIIMFASTLPQIFGLGILGKASYFVQVVGMDAKMSVIVLILGLVCGFLANVASIWLMSRIGRRKLILISLCVLSVLWTAMGIAGCFQGLVTVWYTAITLIFVVVAAGFGVWPASHAVSAETSSLHARAKAQGIAWFTGAGSAALFGFVLPYIFNPDKGNLGAKTGFVYAGLCIIGTVVTFFFVPEMKDRTPAEIDRMFEMDVPARGFQQWSRGSISESRDGQSSGASI